MPTFNFPTAGEAFLEWAQDLFSAKEAAQASAQETHADARSASQSAGSAASSMEKSRAWASQMGAPVMAGSGGGLWSARHYALQAGEGAAQSIESVEVQNGTLTVTLRSGEVLEAQLEAGFDVIAPLAMEEDPLTGRNVLRQEGRYLGGITYSVEEVADGPDQLILSWDTPADFEPRLYKVFMFYQGRWFSLGATSETTYQTGYIPTRVKYRVVAVGAPGVEVVPGDIDLDPPSISGYNVTVDGQIATVSFEASEELGAIRNPLITESGGRVAVLFGGDFEEEGGTYTATYDFTQTDPRYLEGELVSLLTLAEDTSGNATNQSPRARFTIAEAPAAPTGLEASVDGQGLVTLTWADPTGLPLSSIRVLRSAGDATSFEEVASAAPGSEVFQERPPTTPGGYYYALVALAENGQRSGRTRAVRAAATNTIPFMGLPGDVSS